MSKRSVLMAAMAVVGVCAPAAGQETAPAASAAKKEPVLQTPSQMTWVDEPAIAGAKTAVLWGDPKTEGYGKINRWQGGTEVPLHWHTFETRSVVLEGTLTVTLEGAAARELGPGSYLYMPGKVRHVTTCKPGADCVFMTTSRLRFETKVAGREKQRTPD